ncbi:MAG: glycosyltransferase family 1 protein [Kiritimatiellae bacterium]|nr:glycosyltransferase family 1 protein [Kiritimatiellia bacterium]
MKIGIDARWIFNETSGIGVYTAELARHLAQIDKRNQYVLFFRDGGLMNTIMAGIKPCGAENFTGHLLDFGVFSVKNQFVMPALIRKLGLDLFHSTNYMIPMLSFPRDCCGAPACVINIHDLIPLVLPEAAPRALKAKFPPLYRWVMKEVAARSSLIITGSQSSRGDIINLLRCRPERVAAIPDGVSASFRPPETGVPPSTYPRRLRQKKIVLWVGRRDPYKNLAGLVRAFSILRSNYAGPLELRLVGPDDSRYPEAPRSVVALGLADAVRWVGHVSAEELVREYQNADVFVMPSRYEGFGLPVLEAFACGTPVICSNRSSLPEICGSAALQVDPDDAAALADAMRRVLTDFSLADGMTERGIRQAAGYTWLETARRTLQAYEQVAMVQE